MISLRYQVVTQSESGHCCFEATVVDTEKPHPYYKDKFDWICECFDVEQAELIADALNRAEEEKKERTRAESRA